MNLPDEMILAIMNKVKHKVLLLCSIIGTGNNRLEQLALDNCYSIDLTFDYSHSPYDLLVQRFYSSVLPHISDNIQSLTINFKHLLRINRVAKAYSNEILPNLIYVKIMIGHVHLKTGKPIIVDYYDDSSACRLSCFSTVPELYHLNQTISNILLSFFRRSPLMRYTISFEFDSDCVLHVPSKGEGLFFPQSLCLTHIHIGLIHFDDLIRLLYQLSCQLQSLSVVIEIISVHENLTIPEIVSVNDFFFKFYISIN
ncbi:unnamed protein product [Rotaria sp. Silwood2]|nr:unnamed protein product [Rotaria sp. Silwood2]